MAVHETLPHRLSPLIEIDYYSNRLVGCIECNREADTMPI